MIHLKVALQVGKFIRRVGAFCALKLWRSDIWRRIAILSLLRCATRALGALRAFCVRGKVRGGRLRCFAGAHQTNIFHFQSEFIILNLVFYFLIFEYYQFISIN